jgi:hypothetical protein
MGNNAEPAVGMTLDGCNRSWERMIRLTACRVSVDERNIDG